MRTLSRMLCMAVGFIAVAVAVAVGVGVQHWYHVIAKLLGGI